MIYGQPHAVLNAAMTAWPVKTGGWSVSGWPVNHPQSAANMEALSTYEGCNVRSEPMPGIGFNLLC